MQQYQSTPDYYRDYIEHGWLKDQAAKTHKYIKRWRNKAGKWVYQYKKNIDKKLDDVASAYGGLIPETVHKIQNATNKKYKIQRKNRVLSKHDKLSYGYNKGTFPYHSSFERRKQIKEARYNAKTKTKKTSAMKGDRRYKAPATNLSSRGYSRAEGTVLMRGSNLYNNSTRRPPSHLEVEKYLKNDGKNSPSIIFKETKRYYDNYGTGTNNHLYRKQRNKTAAERARKNRRAK